MPNEHKTPKTCDSCPECGCTESAKDFDGYLGDGFRICKNCNQDWWTDIDYPNHIKKKDQQEPGE